MGLIIARVIIWLPGPFARNSGLTSYKSIVCWLPGLVTGDNGLFGGLVAVDCGSEFYS